MVAAPRRPPNGVPDGFRVERETPLGRHPLLAVFPGLGGLALAERLEPDGGARSRLFDETCVQVVPSDVWMYVAPWKRPRHRSRWQPVISPGSDCIVVGQDHLRQSEILILYLDIFHELCHIRQRHAGLELFDDRVSYVRRPTEVEAYRLVVEEAKLRGVPDPVIREYLRVEWISEAEYDELLHTLGVPPGPEAAP